MIIEKHVGFTDFSGEVTALVHRVLEGCRGLKGKCVVLCGAGTLVHSEETR
jgi:hypothetical protein